MIASCIQSSKGLSLDSGTTVPAQFQSANKRVLDSERWFDGENKREESWGFNPLISASSIQSEYCHTLVRSLDPGFNPLISASSIQSTEYCVTTRARSRFQSANNRVFNSERAATAVQLGCILAFQSANNRVFNSELTVLWHDDD